MRVNGIIEMFAHPLKGTQCPGNVSIYSIRILGAEYLWLRAQRSYQWGTDSGAS